MDEPGLFARLSPEDQVYHLKALVQDIVDDYPGGRKALAEALKGTSYITLSRWCNEFLKDYCIPPHMVINLYHLHRDSRLIQFICRNTNHLAIPIPEPPEDFPELAQAVGASSKEFGELLQEVGRAISNDGEGGASITKKELARIQEEAHEAMISIASLLKTVEVLAKGKR